MKAAMDDAPNAHLHTLRRITAILLDSQLPASSLRLEVLEMVETFADSTANRFTQQDEIALGETRTSGGLALSPTMAAMCAVDYVRTIIFIRGISEAIVNARIKCPNRPVRILYAGCGPFGTLAVPLMTVFDSSEAVFSLLDIHPESIQSVRGLVRNLDLEESVASTTVADVSKYRIDAEHPPDIIVIETMQACLDSEPQVALTRHLLQQAPHAVIVPEEVCIGLKLVDPSCEFNRGNPEGEADSLQRDGIHLGSVFVMNKRKVNFWLNNSHNALPGGAIVIPESWEERYQPMLFTKIRIYQGHVLGEYDCGLTCPKVLPEKCSIRPGDEIRFSYVLGSNPHLTFHRSIESSLLHSADSQSE